MPPFTAMRGFGGPQGAFVLEAAIQRAAQQTSLPAEQIQQRSLLTEGDAFPYGQRALRCRAQACSRQADARYQVARWRRDIAAFNAVHPLRKKGLARLPLCFGISFTYIPLNQGSALVHIYLDGSIGFSTGAVEMGQGVTEKLRRVVAEALGVGLARIRAETSNTTRVANVSPSAASFTADLNGKALLNACADLRRHLLGVAAQRLGLGRMELELSDERVQHRDRDTGLAWPVLIQAAYEQRTSLSAQAHYKTPGLAFDADEAQGHPFAYHVYGHALTEVTLDCLRGTYRIDRVAIVHDIGRSLAPAIDRGQIEGAVVQGIGWLTSEELVYDAHGRLLSNSLANYKVPDIHAAPDIDIEFLADAEEPAGLLQSKAVGEPPFLYGIGAYLALLQAIAAFRPKGQPLALDAPLTPERVLLALYPDGWHNDG